MTVPRKKESLTLGKGSAFVQGRLKRLRQEDDTWEADFRALPKPMMQNDTHYLGVVVKKRSGSTLAEIPVEYTPNAKDLATLLAKAMKRPLTGGAHRPRRILVRKNPRWQALFPHLVDLGVELVVQSDLPKVKEASRDPPRQIHEPPRLCMPTPTAHHQTAHHLF